MELVQVSTTTGSRAEAQQIADHLVGQRLAACVQVLGPLMSTYRWEGAVQTDEEFLCLIKTRSELAGRVEASIRSLHSYDNPEVIVTPIQGGSPKYLEWVVTETRTERS